MKGAITRQKTHTSVFFERRLDPFRRRILLEAIPQTARNPEISLATPHLNPLAQGELDAQRQVRVSSTPVELLMRRLLVTIAVAFTLVSFLRRLTPRMLFSKISRWAMGRLASRLMEQIFGWSIRMIAQSPNCEPSTEQIKAPSG